MLTYVNLLDQLMLYIGLAALLVAMSAADPTGLKLQSCQQALLTSSSSLMQACHLLQERQQVPLLQRLQMSLMS